MHQLVQRQREYFNTGASVPKQFRIQQLKKLRSALKENEAALFEAIYSDFKKSQFDTYVTELALVYQDIDEAIRKMDNWTRKQRVRTNLVNFPARSYILPEPLGVSLIIGAWNYPIQLSLAPAVAAMAAGCTVVMKPSEMPAHTSTVLAKIIGETFPAEYFTVVEGGVPETTELLNQRFDKIFFTGSTHVGKIVYKAAAKHLTPVTLELGGKSPVFVTENCSSLKLAVQRIIWGAFLNAGQTCNSPDYILVHRSKEVKFLELCKKEIAKRQIAVEHGNYSQIIDERNFDRLAALIDPDKVYCGGGTDREQRIIEPTILQQVSFDDEVMQDEIFGPVLPVIVYD
ncbi:MAG: aldehyde dehydrogenase family protein, partial [Bacteroidia bacterium]|nr:aldehyde dehydrogenase family protein [Bacteroidia bacterium]